MTDTTGQLPDDIDWVRELSSDGERRDFAITRLRHYLLRGLRRAYASQSSSLPLEDCVQSALLTITSGLPSYRRKSRFTTWAMSIAIRTVVRESRRAHWRDVSLDDMIASGRAALASEHNLSTETEIDQERLFEVVRRVVESGLTEKQRQAIEAELTGAPFDEIARRMNISRNAVYKLTYDARVRLKKAILKAGWTETEIRQTIGLRIDG